MFSHVYSKAQGIREGIRLSEDAYNAIFKPIENRRAFQVLPMLLHPRSKGYLKLKSRNPFHHPLIYPNFFADARDIDTLLEGIREAIKIAEQPEYQALGVELYNATIPGCESAAFNSDEYWRCYIKHLSATLHHQIGTCKMGPHSDGTAVVDANARVHGIKNLRVADVSIIPESPSGHTAAFSFLIGEKIANSIQNDWKPKESNIQKLTRHKRSIDWQYQDPDHTTESRTVPTTTRRYPINQPITTMIPKQTTNPDTMHVLHALNMSAIHRHSHQFLNSTVGDVGIILWGSLTATKTIDFKSKLAENTNSTKTNETNLNSNNNFIMPRILKTTLPQSTTAATLATDIATEKFTETSTSTEEMLTSTGVYTFSSTEVITTQTSRTNKETTATTIQLSTAMSNMEKILATAPTLDEDAIKTYELNENERHGISKDKFITEQLKMRNSTSFSDEMATTEMSQSTTEASTEASTEALTEILTSVANQTKTVKVERAASAQIVNQKPK